MAYNESMNATEKRSLASQINLTVFEMRKSDQPMALHIVNYSDEAVKSLIQTRGGEHWGCVFHKEGLKDAFVDEWELDWSKTVYLSPDSNVPLLDFDDVTNFIIGGLIDRTVIRYASFIESSKHGI